MQSRGTRYLKNSLSILALLLSLAALQSPLWLPVIAPRCLTATVGLTVILPYQGEIEKATIFQKRMATLYQGGPGQLMIHGNVPGKTNLLIRYKHGDTKLYEIVILPG
jgi:hypothetical protein